MAEIEFPDITVYCQGNGRSGRDCGLVVIKIIG